MKTPTPSIEWAATGKPASATHVKLQEPLYMALHQITKPTELMSFISSDFQPPRNFRSDIFRLEVLSPTYAELDFEAVRSSASKIRNVFGPSNSWPSKGITFEENRADLARHEQEFNDRKAFAYAMLDAGGSQYLGCLYIKPVKSKLQVDRRREKFQAQAFFWLSSAQLAVSAQQTLDVLRPWLVAQWPFSAVAFPGRLISWAEWEALAHEGI